jgi:4-amino-4-deoxy-L-arabinose transferase-like glycosyltransferase
MGGALAVLPLLVFGAAVWCARRRGVRWREALLVSAVVLGVWVAVGTEVLSALRWLTAGGVAGWWLVGLLLTFGAVWWVRRNTGQPLRAASDPWHRVESLPNDVASSQRDCAFVSLVAIAAAVLAATFVIAVLTPVNTWDCLQYHLPRQVFWMQQRSVEHFPARDLRQLEMPPLAEFISMHLWLLAGSDRWTNLIQWAALVLSAAGVSLVAKEMGLARRGQALAAVLAVTIPAAATQATNGKNDIVLGLWLVVLYWVAARVWSRRRVVAWELLLAGAALGLALLTKGTAYVFAPAVGALLAMGVLRVSAGEKRPARGVLIGAAACAVAAAINAPHWARNERAFGSPLSLPASEGGFRLAMEDHSPSALVSNALRNLTIHTGTPWEPANAAQTRAAGALHQAIGQEMSDPRTTIRDQTFAVRDTWWHDGNSPAPGHLALGGLVLFAALFRREWLRGLRVPGTAGVALIGMLLFCVLLKWQPWHARLHIPGLLLMAPAAAAVVMRVRWARARFALVAFAAGPVWYAIAVNEAKPLVGPRAFWRVEEALLRNQFKANVVESLAAAEEWLARRGPEGVGLNIGALPQEYAVMHAVMEAVEPDPYFVEMRGGKGRGGFGPARTEAPPDVILSWTPLTAPALLRWHGGEPYIAVWQHGYLTIFEPGTFSEERPHSGAAFVGWLGAEGLHEPQGPFPERGLPVVRWGHGEMTSLWIPGPGRAELKMELRAAARRGQVVTVRLNGEELESLALPPSQDFAVLDLPLALGRGENRLDLEYAAREAGGAPAGRAVLFRKLQVLPVAQP